MKTIAFFAALLGLTAPALADSLDFAMGKALFDRPWSSAPASTQATDGLGPLFNARSCAACHPRNGRGELQLGEDGELNGIGYVLRIGNDKGTGDPVYGRQFQVNSIQGHKAEGRVFFNDYYYDIRELAYGPMAYDTQFAGRIAQPLFGLGLLEKVSDEAILALADPDDKNNDGISGRPNMINGEIGRFAWKATAPSLRIQTANAFSNDIGMSTPVHPHHHGDCTDAQKDCLAGPHGDSPQFESLEIDTQMLNLVTVYMQGIKAPKPAPTQGLDIFKDVGCASCHVPSLPTIDGGEVNAYTDLLLHDMGAGLADGIKEGDASGVEWRTQPLWGSSKTKRFLHDGRAKSVEEAIYWHGGEARETKERFNALSDADKAKLLSFVKGL